LALGFYGSDKISLSEQYYLMGIERGDINSMFHYAKKNLQKVFRVQIKSPFQIIIFSWKKLIEISSHHFFTLIFLL
jgi:hypothetical protein